MSRRDSDSKRRDSRFDRDPSQKRCRRDAKQDRDRDRDRVTTSSNLENGDHMNRDKRSHRQLHQPPLALHSDQEAAAVPKDTANKPNDHYEAPKHALDPTQHDERGSAGQIDQSSGQRSERGWWKDSKNQHNERAETSHSTEQRDKKSQAKPDDNTFKRRDGFCERKDDPPPTTRKRPAFREKKIPVDSGDANPAVAMAVKSSQIDHPPERNERREERRCNPHHLDGPEKQFADDRAPNNGEARRDRFPLRGRYGANGGNSNYKGRYKFNGRQGYRPSTTRAEKWKHDLYQEVNKDPITRNEDDQIAKLEALLAS